MYKESELFIAGNRFTEDTRHLSKDVVTLRAVDRSVVNIYAFLSGDESIQSLGVDVRNLIITNGRALKTGGEQRVNPQTRKIECHEAFQHWFIGTAHGAEVLSYVDNREKFVSITVKENIADHDSSEIRLPLRNHVSTFVREEPALVWSSRFINERSQTLRRNLCYFMAVTFGTGKKQV